MLHWAPVSSKKGSHKEWLPDFTHKLITGFATLALLDKDSHFLPSLATFLHCYYVALYIYKATIYIYIHVKVIKDQF